MNFQNFIAKLRNLPDKHKKVILWTIVVILAGAMLFFWFNLAKKRVSNLGETIKKIELPQVETLIETAETEKDETADWKTYKNDEYGFEIKYPDTINIKENLNGDTYKTDIGIFKKPLFFFLDNINNKGFLILYNNEKNYPIPRMMWIEENKKTVVNGIMMDRIVNGSQDSKLENIYISYSFEIGEGSNYNDIQNYLFVIYSHRLDDKSIRLFDKIISTFKFIK